MPNSKIYTVKNSKLARYKSYMDNAIYPPDLAFNLVLLEEKIRKLYYYDIYHTSKIRKILESIGSRFHIFYVLFKKDGNNELVDIEKFMELKKDCRILICLQTEKMRIANIIVKDSVGKIFGELQSLMCADDLRKMYRGPNRHKLVQVRYDLIYKGKKSNFMRQMCMLSDQLETNIKEDLAKYKKIADKLDIKIDFSYGNLLLAKSPEFISKAIWKIIDLFMK